MSRRINLLKTADEGYKAMFAIEGFVNAGKVPQTTLELIKMRVSQINGCGYCIDMHSRDAKQAGETDQRLFAVGAWRDTPFYTEAERAALDLAEAMTRIADNPAGVPDDVWDQAADLYDEEELATLIFAIAAINSWNRLNVTARNEPALRKAQLTA
jgi:AhpD family alkylhydroperoxidase